MADPIIEHEVLTRIRTLTPQQKRRLMTSVEAARMWCPKITNANWHLLIDAVEKESEQPPSTVMDDLLVRIGYLSIDQLLALQTILSDAVACGAVSVQPVRNSFTKSFAFVDRHGHTVAEY